MMCQGGKRLKIQINPIDQDAQIDSCAALPAIAVGSGAAVETAPAGLRGLCKGVQLLH